MSNEEKNGLEEIQAHVEVAAAEQAENTPIVTEEELLKLAEQTGDLPSGDATASEEDTDVAELTLSTAERMELMASMETILFMSDKAVSLPKLRSTLNPQISLNVYRELMAELRAEFAKDFRGVEIAELGLGFQLRTKPHMSAVLRRLVKTQPIKLSPATMETLSIVAYKQPTTKDDIDQIRGVDSGYILRNLMEKRLIKIQGRSELPGRPLLYGTTHEFLELFSLKDVSALPPLHEIEAMVAASEVGAEEREKQQLEDFSNMVLANTKVLFDDSKLDEELEAIRSEIAKVSTSTPFIEDQKYREKCAAKGIDPETGLPVGAIAAETESVALTTPEAVSAETPLAEEPATAHEPSLELQAAAQEAQAERHSEIISEAVADAAPTIEAEPTPEHVEFSAEQAQEPEQSPLE